MSIQEAIEAAVFARAGQLAAVTGLPLAWPNRKSTARPPFLRIDHMPNINTRLFINSATHLRPGLVQITVHAPLDAGADDATRIAGQVAEHFPMDLRMASSGLTVRIAKAPDIAGALKGDAAWLVPVTVSYEAFA